MSFFWEAATWLDLVELVGLLCLPVFLALDLIWREREFQTPAFWRGRAAVVTWMNFHLAVYISIFWGGVFGAKSLIGGSGLGTLGGAAVGVVAYELAHYWYHRTAHRWEPLWRATHQMHHSAESVDAFGAYYLHPLDNAMFTTLASWVFFPVLGLSAEAGLVASVFLTFNAVFQHANIRTPRWLGYLIQRPESHRIHHARGVHRHNYSDLPLWDIVFGTFSNPATDTTREGGFYRGASSRIPEMLIGIDVTKERAERPNSPRGRSALTRLPCPNNRAAF